MSGSIRWPDGKDFAFTIFDDCDYQTAENVRAVYDFITEIGLRTTKTVWTVRGSEKPGEKITGGATCDDEAYLKWALDLQALGFEIALHNVSYHTSPRERTLRGMTRFHEWFGHDPYCLANHTGCHEGIYWGDARLTGLHRTFYNLMQRNRYRNVFQGHVPESELYWGDICREKVTYIRNFVFDDINTLHSCPEMPYHDPHRPLVNYWFSASEGPTVEPFVAMISEANQDRLAAEHGACIMYTHLACGFCDGTQLNTRFRERLLRLSRMNGWFVPVHTLLDYLRLAQPGERQLTNHQRRRLEQRWFLHKIRTRGTT
jgi:hypothetical protein